jgi:hypothetical protein
MSGYLDENFSYVHPGGLSEKSGAIDEQKLHKETPTHHYINTEPLKQRQTSQSVSTHTLTLNSVFASRLYATQMDSRTRNEISKIVAMQLRSDVLAEQLFVESRLRSLDLNAFPLLGMGNSFGGQGVNNSLESARGKSLSISAPSMSNHSASHNNIQEQRQQSHKKREKRQRKQQDFKYPPLDWCPISIQESQHNITDSPFNSPQHGAEASIHSHHMRFGSLRGNGLMGLSGAGSGTIAPKQSANIQPPQKVGERSKKRRSVRTYFGQEEFALENSIPKSESRDKHGIPVVVPVLDQGPIASRTKQVNKLTTLHRLPSKFTPNSELNFANTIS